MSLALILLPKLRFEVWEAHGTVNYVARIYGFIGTLALHSSCVMCRIPLKMPRIIGFVSINN